MKRKLVFIVLAGMVVSSCTSLGGVEADSGARTAALKLPNSEARGKFVVGKQYKVKGVVYKPRVDLRYRAEGIASWYGEGDGFNGKRTANGARYDKYGYTAAHPTMALPSVARVTNLANKKSIYVVVNDRGPFHKGRIIDVSKKAAEDLGFAQQGTAKVRVEYSHQQTLSLLAHYPKIDRDKAVGQYRLAAFEQGLATNMLN